ncbi:xylanase 3 [Pochonia chlamydosporia 170]|uniref:Xylanase 3 n=1 Tax=Pochonia chlamydosporia 170 TaxID=1380566 RepID=A0A179FWS5_METCM|nr:xylanase 3 [Pochonia chlamydosporia 170]OAQ70084.1 xylanase 3 [Pochonia chlamydosporia 170]
MRLSLSTTASLIALVQSSLVPDSSCDCFLTNSSEPAYFSNHLFFDFRNLASHASVSAAITNPKDTPTAPPTSKYFQSEAWTKSWELQTWSNSKGGGNNFAGDATVLMINSPNNIYIERSTDSATHLTLRTKRLASFQTAAQFQSQSSNYQYLSLRLLARTVGEPGGVSAFFTYRDAGKLADIQEADLEVVTQGPRKNVHCTNQPSYTENGATKPDVTRNATLPRGLGWSDWAVYRLDWTPGASVWYVDGEMIANITFQVPRDAAGINFNSWGDGGSWSGNMSVGAESSLQIQWIEMVFNTTDSKGRSLRRDGSGSAKGGLCGAVCSIDDGAERGKGVTKLWGEKTKSAGVRMEASWCLLVFVVCLVLEFS